MAYASVKITANSSDYRTQMKSAAAQMRELSSEYSVAATKAKLFGSETDSLKAKAESLTQKITVQKNIVQMNKEQQERLTVQLGKQKTKQEELKTKVDAAKKAYEDEKKATGENSDASKALKEELDKLEQEFKDNETAIGKTETALSNQTVKTNRAETALMEMEAELKDVNKELKNHRLDTFANGCKSAGEKMESFGQKMSIVSGGIAGIAAASIKTASDFDTSMSNVQAISGATAEEMEKLREKARKMGEKTKFSATEAGSAMSYMAMAGWQAKDMMGGIEGIMNLAAASGEDLASTSDIVTDAMTAFGLSADGTTKIIKNGFSKEVPNATRFADVLAAASSNANTNVSMLGQSFKYVAPVAGSLGYSVEDTAVALGLMANSGIKASQGGTALRTMLTNLSKPTEQIYGAMEYLGISLQNNDGSMKSLMDIMKDLRGSFGQCKMPIEEFQKQLESVEERYASGELTEKKYNKAVQDLTEKAYGAEGALKAKFAATLAGKEGMSGLLAIVSASDKDFGKLTDAIYDSDGAAEKMADIMQDNLGGQLTILKSQTQELGISIGEQLIPHIRSGVGTVQDIVDKFNSLGDSQKKTIIKVGLVVAAVGPLAIGFGKVAQGISTTIKTGQQFVSGVTKIIAKITAKTAATAAGTAADAAGTAAEAAHTAATTTAATATGGMTAAQTALNAVMSMNPIALVVIAIAALVAGFVLLYNKSETFRNAVNKLWETVKKAFGAIKNIVSKLTGAATETVKQNLSNMKKAYEENGGGIKGVVAAGWEGIKGFYTSGFTFVDKLTGGKLTELKNKFLNSGIGKAASKIFGGVKDTALKVMGAATETVKQNLSNMKKAYEENGGGIKGVVAAGWEGIKGFYTSGFTFVDKLTGGKLTDIKKKFSSRMSEIKSDWSTKFTNIKDTATNLMQTAKQNVSTRLDNMKAAYNEKGGGMKGIVSATFTGIKDTVDSRLAVINTLTGGKLDKLRTAFSEKLNSAKSTVFSIMGNISSEFSSKMDSARTAVSGAIDKIKGFFKFSWSLPQLKMPHPKITGKFSLNPPSVPTFSVEWYKTGAIMNSSMIFGMNGNTLLAGGEPETGGEAILPLAPFYAKLNDILDKKLTAVQQIQNVYVENHTYIDGEEISNRTVSKVDAKMVWNKRKGR